MLEFIEDLYMGPLAWVMLAVLIGIFLSWLFRCSIAASIIGNLIGNPWTFPFIILINFKIGNYLFITESNISFNVEDVYNEFTTILASIFSILFDGNFNNFINMLMDLKFLPVILYGSLFTCINTGLVSYFFIKKIVINYQRRKLKFNFINNE